MTTPRHDHDLALLAAGHDTGFWDEPGRPAPWPDDIDEWRPAQRTHHPTNRRTIFLTSTSRKIRRYTTSREDLTEWSGFAH
jgi:hypothetical protein